MKDKPFWKQGDHGPPGPPWKHHHHHRPRPWRHRPRFLFARFAGTFGCMVVLVLGGMAAFAFLLSRLFGDRRPGHALIVWVAGIGLGLLLPLLAVAIARGAFRGIATPLADVMTAADRVAEGDLSARVPVQGHEPFNRLAQSFNRMTEELERADKRRRNLTADVAHELRTPLQIIQGNLEGIIDDVYDPTEEHIEATLEETRLLARLVEDLRTLSLAEAGELPLVWEPANVAELLADARTSFSGQAEAAGIDLQVEINGVPLQDLDPVPPRSDLRVVVDMDRIDQVLGNLVANALRHTPPGETIGLQAVPIEDGVRISVCDTGEGIPAEDLPYVFDRFWKGDRARSPGSGAGSGLGLAIARQLVQAHDGHIVVESKPGQGTCFTIDLPRGEHRLDEHATKSRQWESNL